jgi:hypothetical protein
MKKQVIFVLIALNGNIKNKVMEEDKKVKMYFKGDSGIKQPADMDGNLIKEGCLLTRDYGDNEKYKI